LRTFVEKEMQIESEGAGRSDGWERGGGSRRMQGKRRRRRGGGRWSGVAVRGLSSR
jgi:hypothetical protein